jgi:hypothetical protein
MIKHIITKQIIFSLFFYKTSGSNIISKSQQILIFRDGGSSYRMNTEGINAPHTLLLAGNCHYYQTCSTGVVASGTVSCQVVISDLNGPSIAACSFGSGDQVHRRLDLMVLLGTMVSNKERNRRWPYLFFFSESITPPRWHSACALGAHRELFAILPNYFFFYI